MDSGALKNRQPEWQIGENVLRVRFGALKGLSVRDAERLAQQKKAKRFKTVKEPHEKDADTKALEQLDELIAKLG